MRRIFARIIGCACAGAAILLLVASALYAANCDRGCKEITCWKDGAGFKCVVYSAPSCPGDTDFWAISPPGGTCGYAGDGSVDYWNCDCDVICDNDAAIAASRRERTNCRNSMTTGAVLHKTCQTGM